MTVYQRLLKAIAVRVKPLVPGGVRLVSYLPAHDQGSHIELVLGRGVLVWLSIHQSHRLLVVKLPGRWVSGLPRTPGMWVIENGDHYVTWLLLGRGKDPEAETIKFAITGVAALVNNIIDLKIRPRLSAEQQHLLHSPLWPDN